jgi:hypothetical protein
MPVGPISIAGDDGSRQCGVWGIAPAALGVLLDAAVPITCGCSETSIDELEFDSREEDRGNKNC